MAEAWTAELMPLEVSYQELRAQPAAVAATLREQGPGIGAVAQLILERGITRAYLVGCGDSYYASLAARLALESLWGVPCEVAQAFEYAHYGWRLTDRHTAVIGLSSSGRSQASVQAMSQAAQRGALMVGVTNTADSPFTRDVDASILVRATRAGWPTQASTAALASLYLLAAELAQKGNAAASADAPAIRRQVESMPSLMERTLRAVDRGARELAVDLVEQGNFLYVGAGPSYGTAHFGMAKLKEASQEHSAILELEEYSHIQSFALREGEPVFVVAPPGSSSARAAEIARRVVQSRGRVIALIDRHDEALAALATYRFLLPPVDERLSPLIYVLPLQLFAYYLAVNRVARGYRRPLRVDYDD